MVLNTPKTGKLPTSLSSACSLIIQERNIRWQQIWKSRKGGIPEGWSLLEQSRCLCLRSSSHLGCCWRWGEGQHRMGSLENPGSLIFKFSYCSAFTILNFILNFLLFILTSSMCVSGKRCHWHWLWEGFWPDFYSLPTQVTRGSDTNVGSPGRVRMGMAGTDYISWVVSSPSWNTYQCCSALNQRCLNTMAGTLVGSKNFLKCIPNYFVKGTGFPYTVK